MLPTPQESASPAAVEAAVDKVNAQLGEAPLQLGSPNGGTFRFELYQAGISICSQKVRTVLLEKNLPFLAHELNPRPDAPLRHHFPDYVRMRLLGALPEHKLTSGFSGGTAVSVDGLEPTVVPTLIDHEAGKVVLDSRAICNYIDRVVPDPSPLIPEGREAETEALIDLVDTTPHPSLLMGADSPLDRRPPWLKSLPVPDAHVKIQLIEHYLEGNEEDPILGPAYRAKIAREKAALEFHDRPGRIEKTIAELEEILRDTEAALSRYPGDYLLGNAFTMADVHTVLSLFRLQNMGWRSLFGPKTQAYADLTYRRDSVVKGMVAWPSTWFWAPDYFDDDVLDLYQGPKPPPGPSSGDPSRGRDLSGGKDV